MDDGLHLDRLLRHPGLAVHGQHRVVERRRNLTWEHHQRRRTHLRLAGLGVGGGHRHHQRLNTHRKPLKARRCRTGAVDDEAGIDAARRELAQLHVQGRLAQREGQVGIGLAELTQPLRQAAKAHGRDEGQAQSALHAGRHRTHLCRQSCRLGQQALGRRAQGLARRRQGHAAAAALKQAQAQGVLQLADGLGERRLGHVKGPRGAAKVQALGHGQELLKQAQIDH
jgi:hypothetical protein